MKNPTTLSLKRTKAIVAAVAGAALVCACASPNSAAPAAAPAAPPAAPPAAASTGAPTAAAAAPAAPRPASTGAAAAEGLPQVRACTSTPKAALMAKGPDQETYVVRCSDGYGLLVQCSGGGGGCKVLNPR